MNTILGKAMLFTIIFAGLLKIAQKLFAIDHVVIYYLQMILLATSLIAALVLTSITYINSKNKSKENVM